MAADLPVACTLSAAEMPDRLAAIGAIGRDGLVSVVVAQSEAILRFRPGAEMLGRLETIVAAESKCCAFLRFGLAETEDEIVLTVATPEGGEPALQGIIDAFRGAPA